MAKVHLGEKMLNWICVFILCIYSFMTADILKASENNAEEKTEKSNLSFSKQFMNKNDKGADSVVNSEKYTLSICTIFKNEAPYLREWIEYHLILGVDHFYLCNIGSQDDFQKVLKPYIEEGIVTLINWHEAVKDIGEESAYQWSLSTQIPAYEHVVNFRAKGETKWLMLVDVEEFLVYPKGCTITDLLEKYEDYSGITVSSDFFDATQDSAPQKKLLIQTLNLSIPPAPVGDKTVAKMIFKPNDCAGFTWPPYQCRLKKNQSTIVVEHNELRLNKYTNRSTRYLPYGKLDNKLDIDNRNVSQSEISCLLQEGYVIEDQDRSIFQHIPELMKRLNQ